MKFSQLMALAFLIFFARGLPRWVSLVIAIVIAAAECVLENIPGYPHL